MKVEFDLPEKTLRKFLDAVDDYLEYHECSAYYERLNDEDIEELKEADVSGTIFAIAQMGHIVHKAVIAQTEDKDYRNWYKVKEN